MAAGDATSSDIPGRYDVAINGKGYMLLQSLEPSLPFRTHRAAYSYSPTFVDRSNVSNAYGDNAQEFFLTIRQRDWSLGEQQKYYRAGQDGRYWVGSNVDVSIPGQVTLAHQITTVSFAQSVISGSRGLTETTMFIAGTANLYQVDQTGAITDKGAHGLGATPARFGVACDGTNAYLGSTSGGSVGVRKWNGTTFSTFSASLADSLAFLNNTLYGLNSSNQTLLQFDTSGNASVVFTWKAADGSQTGMSLSKLEPFGGKLLILVSYGQEGGGELWIYDGLGCQRLEVLPANFDAYDIDVLYGVAYISGEFFRPTNSSVNRQGKPAVLFYDGTIGKLWEQNDFAQIPSGIAANQPTLGVSDGKLLFTDDIAQSLMAYNPALGGVSTLGGYTVASDQPRLISAGGFVMYLRNQATAYIFPNNSYPSSGSVTSSLIDFDNSLMKLMRGVRVEWAAASDGDGGSVDISYQIDSLTGAWTTLKAAAASGTEYTFTGVTGHSIAVKITLNKGTSTAGPTLKAVSVRGAPILTTFRNRTYILDLSGIGTKDQVRLADGTEHPLSGHEQADNLNAAVTAGLITVSDRFVNRQTSLNGTTTTDSFSAVCVPADCEIYDVREGWDNAQYPGGYVARITVREV